MQLYNLSHDSISRDSILLPFRRGARIELIGVLRAAFEMDVIDISETHEWSPQRSLQRRVVVLRCVCRASQNLQVTHSRLPKRLNMNLSHLNVDVDFGRQKHSSSVFLGLSR